MNDRLVKQLIIGLVYLIIFTAIGYGVYSSVKVQPVCTDGIQNGKEEGVDCGVLACGTICEASVQPLQVLYTKLILGNGDYDVVAQVSNPNTNYGSSQADYTLTVTNDLGQSNQLRGQFYILPGQTRYVAFSALKDISSPSSVALEISAVQWQKLDLLSNQNVSLAVSGKQYQKTTDKIGSQVSGAIVNESDYDFDKVDLTVVIFDSQDNIAGVSTTNLTTFLGRSQRGFVVQWPIVFADPARMDVEAVTDLFSDANFIKTNGIQEKFQKYY